ncbi:MBL fold metallo-hydrolase [Candidatus Gracilibacteria bacterium]|nr:MBL fold metallo-hydrolase [Candidatus Gracilibacteria bacterium]
MKFVSILFLLGITGVLASCSQEVTPTPDISVAPDTNTGEIVETESLDSNTDNMSSNYTESNNVYTFTTENGESVEVNPISHATMILNWSDTTMYIDPAEAIESYAGYNSPDIVLVTHEHGDHFNLEVLEQIVGEDTELYVNDAVFQKLSEDLQAKAIVMANGDLENIAGFEIMAVPAYNIREEALNYHPQGRDNGYVIDSDGFRVYISGDTEDTPEMRALTDIDVAFVSMNLPYTMPIDSAISGVIAFAPKTIFPYHFRGEEGMSDVEKFKTEVTSSSKVIDVVLARWY